MQTMLKSLLCLGLGFSLLLSTSSHANFWAQQQTTTATPKPVPVKTVPTTAITNPQTIAIQSKPKSAPKLKPLTYTEVESQSCALLGKANDAANLKLWQSFLNSPSAKLCERFSAQTQVAYYNSQLQNYPTALHHYQSVVNNKAVQQCANSQTLQAKALNGKGYVLIKLGQTEQALATFKQVPALAANDCAGKCSLVVALSNIAELSLITEKHSQAIAYAEKAINTAAKNDSQYAIMHFLLWLLQRKSEREVLKATNQLNSATEYTWDWRDIKPFIAQLPPKKQSKAKCFIEFFETTHDQTQLKACLK